MTPSAEQQAFGRTLRAERERRRVALDAIAATTKIKKSTLAKLEAGDAAAMPAGIFRRDYVRQYAVAIGVPAEPVVAEFIRLFEEGEPPSGSAAQAAGGLRLTLAVDPRDDAAADVLAIAAAVGEACVLAAVAAVLALSGFASFWPVLAVTALGYYVVSSARLGRSPARWYVEMRAAARRRLAEPGQAPLPDVSEHAA